VQDGRILFRNPQLETLFGPVREGLEFRRWMDIHPEDAAPFGALCEALDSGALRPTEADLRFYPSGKAAEGVGARWVHLRATPIDHEGKPAALLSMQDVTRARELEHLVRVREKMSALGHVATGIAHEIRNPLSGINIYLSNLEHLFGQAAGLEPAEREKIIQIVGKLRSASERIASVIHKVMEFSKPAPPRMSRVNLNAAVEEAVRLSVTELRKHDVRLEKCLAPDLPPCAADLRLVEQVVLNLINNASQAMEGIDGPKRLEVASFRDRARVIVRVSDSGPGIPPGLRSKIFDPFFTTRKEGYGIGLSFSHRIVADHGGLLSVGTSRWGGAEFRMEIPCEEEEDGCKTASSGGQASSLENQGPPVAVK
jgi:PAS domain S-box-containing protein